MSDGIICEGRKSCTVFHWFSLTETGDKVGLLDLLAHIKILVLAFISLT